DGRAISPWEPVGGSIHTSGTLPRVRVSPAEGSGPPFVERGRASAGESGPANAPPRSRGKGRHPPRTRKRSNPAGFTRAVVALRTGRHFQLESLAPGVHAAIATQTGYGLCNAGIVDLGGRTVVFDSMLTPVAGADLARVAERCTGQKPTWVVNSHWHGDHIWGNSAFVDAHVVSSRRVRREVLGRSRRQFDQCRREFPKELTRMAAPGSPIAPRDRPQVRAWFRGVVETPRSLRIIPPEVTF